MGRTAYVEADIAQGRLVVPFDLVIPSAAGFYLVCPEATADQPKIAAFRDWLKASASRDKGTLAPPLHLAARR
jgi:LysR family glycine cleavage system transcriptional activator